MSRGGPGSRRSRRERPRSFSSWPSARPRPIRRRTRWRACASAAFSSGSPIIARHGGCSATCRTKGAGPGRSPSSKLRDGYVNHPIFGWVLADWVPHLDRGELPAPLTQRARTRLAGSPPRRPTASGPNWNPPWYINTEHFEIQTNVTLAEAISFGRRLEAFHDLFMTLLADILGENLPLVRRFKDPSMTGEPALTNRTRSITSAPRANTSSISARARGPRSRTAWVSTIRPNQAATAACRPISSATRPGSSR